MSQFAQRSPLDDAREMLRAGRHDDADRVCQMVLKRDRKNLNALHLLGISSLERGRLDDAESWFKKALAIQPREAHFQYMLARVAETRARAEEAISRCDEALRLNPGLRPARGLKAAVLERSGRYDEARAALEPLGAALEEEAATAALMARLEHRAKRHAEALAILDRQLARSDLAPAARQSMLYLKGKICDRTGDYDRAFDACSEANQIGRMPFDEARFVAQVDEMIAVFSKERMATYPRARTRSEAPVIVAGMPRSGTTLIEQIIDAHPKGAGAGEIGGIDFFTEFPQYPEWMAGLTLEAIDKIAASGLSALLAIGRGAERIVNKSLWNYRQLGLMALLYPGGRVIHSKRDPRDVCLSCFLEHLRPERHPYAADLHNLGVVHKQCERLMAHWKDVCGLPVLDVSYEAMVEDQERESKRIIDFLGLEWDEKCLRYYDSGRMVMTLSYDQVTKPIYTSSIGRWRNYERRLGPLFEALGA